MTVMEGSPPAGALPRDAAWAAPPEHWRQRPGVRAAVATAVVVALLGGLGYLPGYAWTVHLVGGVSWQLGPIGVMLALGLLLTPALPKVSYRRRDLLLIALIPLFGQFLVGKVIYRLLSLPRRDWPPRPDERPRLVPVLGEPRVYLLPATFADAEELRSQWCTNPQHRHPYPTWDAAQQDGRIHPAGRGCGGVS
jgi:hypothetical protein